MDVEVNNKKVRRIKLSKNENINTLNIKRKLKRVKEQE
jgi:hypothetical protein